jgi:hypothetical protein
MDLILFAVGLHCTVLSIGLHKLLGFCSFFVAEDGAKVKVRDEICDDFDGSIRTVATT